MLTVKKGKSSGNLSNQVTHFGGLSQDGEAVLVYGDDEKGKGRKWLSKRSLNPANLAGMLAGTFGIQRPRGKEVLIPRSHVNPNYSTVDLSSNESLKDPRVLDAIEILKAEGCDISPITKHLAEVQA